MSFVTNIQIHTTYSTILIILHTITVSTSLRDAAEVGAAVISLQLQIRDANLYLFILK